MAYDLKRTWTSKILGRQILSGQSIVSEGQLLCRAMEDGVEKVYVKAVAAAGDIVVGYSQLGDAMQDRDVAFDSVVVPAAPNDLLIQGRANIATGSIRAVIASTGTALTIDTTYADSPADGAVKVDLATGRFKFHADEAGQAITLTYSHVLTLDQAQIKYGQRFFNNRGLHAAFGQLEMGAGEAELWTTHYDTSKDWTGTAPLTLGDNGIVSQGGAGPVLNARVIAAPSVVSSFLGIHIWFTP